MLVADLELETWDDGPRADIKECLCIVLVGGLPSIKRQSCSIALSKGQ